MNVQLQSKNGNVEVWRIDEPTVTAAATAIPQIQLNAGDIVSIIAGGCVQTGGVGKTWKRYVDPSGPNSGNLYHGTVLLPGMGGFIRLSSLGANYVVPPNTNGILQIGYEDDHYSDNGYWGHDDGTEDQCKGVGNAWLSITIIRNVSVGAVLFAGIEFTQSTQYFNFNGQGSGFAPDNSILMVSGKPTLVRVYADVLLRGIAQIDGTLTIAKGAGAPTVLNSVTGPITARSAADIQRAEWTDTLNFLIPASSATGTLEFEIVIVDPSDAARPALASGIFDLSFFDVEPVAFHSVLIHYTGVDYFDNPVNKQTEPLDVAVALDFVLRTYPISEINFDGCEVLEWNQKLAVSANFYALFAQVANLRGMANSSDICIALIPREAGCGGTCGLGGGRVALFFAGTFEDGTEASHEIGHAIGRAHAPGCLPPGEVGDLNYPQYGTFPRASVGECGVDTRGFDTFPPDTHFDYMSYCGTPLRWTSPYGYAFALNQILKAPLTGPEAGEIHFRGRRRQKESIHYIAFEAYRPHSARETVKMLTAFQVEGHLPTVHSGAATRLRVELYDKEGLWLLTVPCYSDNTTDPNEVLPMRPYFATFPDYSEYHSLRILRDDSDMATFDRTADAPIIHEFRMQEVSDGSRQKVRLEWRASTDGNAVPPLQFGVRFTGDGQHWRALSAAQTGNSLVVSLDVLPGGKQCHFQLVASAGFRSSTKDLALGERPLKPRTVYIVSPKEGEEFQSGSPVYLAGTAFSPDYRICPSEQLVWTSLTSGNLGVGQQVTMTHLPVGVHHITLHASDGQGGVQTKTVQIRILSNRNSKSPNGRPRRPRPTTHVPCRCKH